MIKLTKEKCGTQVSWYFMFKRKLYESLLAWKDRSHGRTALLVEGPRRVGKSTTVGEFAEAEYRSCIIIDFAAVGAEVRALFDDVADLDYIFLRLQLIYGVRLFERESLIVFDEVQLCPLARQAIKQLVADGRYDYIETGSLISIKKNVKNIVIPSEEERIEMHPMDYEEFRWALGDDATPDLIRQAFRAQRPLGDAANRKLMRDFRLYMLVGGMPQAVQAYLDTNNFSDVDHIKRLIIGLYEEDFYKIDESGGLSRLFDSIPAQLARFTTRYHVTSAVKGMGETRGKTAVSELLSSKTVEPAYRVGDPMAGLAATADQDAFKLYVADTGLFVTLAFKDSDFVDNVIYEKLLADKLPSNLGSLYENAIAQALVANGRKLYYHTWPKPGAKRSYEIDFVIPDGKKICPIEVKSSGYKAHSSLDAFVEKYSERVGRRYLVYTKDQRRDGELMCEPTYMSMCL